jgi:hypothetical protein
MKMQKLTPEWIFTVTETNGYRRNCVLELGMHGICQGEAGEGLLCLIFFYLFISGSFRRLKLQY